MFAYVDPAVKKKLIEQGKLLCIDSHGVLCTPEEASRHPFISIVGPVPLPVHLTGRHETFQWYAWVHNTALEGLEDAIHNVRVHGEGQLYGLVSKYMAVNSILIFGNFAQTDAPLVRVHSNCLTGDVFGSMRCDCGPQLLTALEQIADEGAGALVYMAGHEGRGIGLWAKAITYLLQDAGHDTYEANERLGLPADSRDFSDAGTVLRFFLGGPRPIRLMGNNPLKREALEQMEIEVKEQRQLVTGVTSYNTRYLNSKREHGHLIDKSALDK